jgi:hypothetical protein
MYLNASFNSEKKVVVNFMTDLLQVTSLIYLAYFNARKEA